MNLADKTIILTGGTGLIGTYVTDILINAGAHVISFSRTPHTSSHKNLEYVHADLKSLDNAPHIEHADYMVYMAASIPQLHEQKESLFDAKENTLDPFLSFLKRYGEKTDKIIFTSTIDIYGYPTNSSFDESTTPVPPTPYALAKLASEEYLQFFAKTYTKPYVILRYSQVYGPDEPFVRVIPYVIQAVRTQKPFTLYGNPNNRRKFLFARDAARAVMHAIEYPKSDIFQIAGPEEVAIKDIVSTVESIIKRPIEIIHKNPDSPEVHLIPSTHKAESLLGFKPQTLFREGIQEVLQTTHTT